MTIDANSNCNSEQKFLRRVVIVIALIAVMAAAWALADILLLAFGSVLVAVLLRAIAKPMSHYMRIPERVAIMLAVLLVVLLIAAGVYFFGPELARQMRALFERMPGALARIAETLQIGSFTELLKGAGAASSLGNMLSRAFAWSTSIIGAVASIVLVIVGGIYLAADPTLYRQGLVKLFPAAVQASVGATLDDAGEALERWLGAQLIAMILVGALTGLGLFLAGVPNAFALGLIVGLADFVPYIGPLFAAVPILLIASTQDWHTLIWAIAVLVIVQQIESNLIVPMLAGRLVSMAPVVGLFSVIALGVLFGPLGLLLAFPLAIVIDVAIRRLYVLDSLGENVEILGETAQKSQQ